MGATIVNLGMILSCRVRIHNPILFLNPRHTTRGHKTLLDLCFAFIFGDSVTERRVEMEVEVIQRTTTKKKNPHTAPHLGVNTIFPLNGVLKAFVIDGFYLPPVLQATVMEVVIKSS